MSIQNKSVLKSYFLTSDIPTQAQFSDLIDTLVNNINANTFVSYDSGNVGINTDVDVDPGYQLQIEGSLCVTGNVVINEDMAIEGTLSTNDQQINHIKGFGTVPVLTNNTGAGTTPTTSISGTDLAGRINVTTGTACPVDAVIVRVTFGRAYGSIPNVTLSPYNKATVSLTGTQVPYVSTVTTAYFEVSSNDVALGNSTAYSFNYSCIA